MADPIEVLDFWLNEVGEAGWYAGGEAVDLACRMRFGEVWQAAFDGGLDHWVDGTPGTLAYLIVCDQFARNIHRGNALAFATDALALTAARKAVAEGWDMDAPEPARQFFYMPFEHSENAGDQALAIDYMCDRMPSHPDMLLHARAHAQVIAEFRRFPFRNAALGRASTADEVTFMAAGGYGGVVRALQT